MKLLYAVLGFVVPLIALVPILYKFIFLITVAVVTKVFYRKANLFALGYLLFILFNIIVLLIYEFHALYDYRPDILRQHLPDFIYTSISQNSFIEFFNILLLSLFIPIRFRELAAVEYFIKYAFLSLFLVSILLLLNYSSFINYIFFRNADFWQNQSRFSASFTDPNAYGVFVGIFSPFMFYLIISQKSRTGKFNYSIISFFILLSASLSGSRTFFIAISASLLLMLYSAILKNTNKKLKIAYISLALTICLLPVLISNTIDCKSFSVSFRRSCETLNISTMRDALFSRNIFWKYNVQAFASNPLVGVGYNRFEQELDYLKRNQASQIGNWSDNPNSFYLGILSETGIFGLIILSFVFFHYRLRLNQGYLLSASRNAALILMISLITGPHINFTEVAVLAGIILGLVLEDKDNTKKIKLELYLISIAFLAIGVIFTSFASNKWRYGLYSVENENGLEFYWTKKSARLTLPCKNGKASLVMRALNPDLSLRTLSISLESKDLKQSILVGNQEWQTVDLKCHSDSILVDLEISRTWSPAVFFDNKDQRELGVQIQIQ